MHLPITTLIAYFFAMLALCGLGYLVLSFYGALRFLRATQPPPGIFQPAVSILKPLRGTDREMYDGFRSHCLQDYPEYEIIFGVNDPDDPAVADVERLQAEFPERKIKLVICPAILGANGKVSNLAQMLPEAAYDHVLVNDSDIRVEPDYLRRVMAHFNEPTVGMVTTLYRAHAGNTLSSRIEAVTIGTDFAGGVLSALVIERGMHFALGSTLAIRRDVLRRIGGFEAIVNHLADDYELGIRTSRAGYEVRLSDVVVDTYLPDYTFAAMFAHQLRWSRTVRDMRKLGYLGVLLTFALPWALAAALFAKLAPWSLGLLMSVVYVRFVTGGLLCGQVLRDRRTLRDLWLIPLRDILGVVIWAAAFASDTITWRGEEFHLHDGILKRVES